jgi:hypothetical protein
MRLAVGLLLLSACLPISVAAQEIDDTAIVIIARTRATVATYSVYSWNRVTRPGEKPFEEWSAEFHKHDFHRVETPRERLIADCSSKVGVALSVETGKVVNGSSIAEAACGVQANSKIVAATNDGVRATPFGPADLITVRDPENVRTYEVLENGVIVGATIATLDGVRLLTMQAIAVSDTARDDIFSVASLDRSAVPGEFQQAPAD